MKEERGSGLTAEKVTEIVTMAVKSNEERGPFFAEIQHQLLGLHAKADEINVGVQEMAQDLSGIKLEIVQSNQEILEQLRRLASSQSNGMEDIFELEPPAEDRFDERSHLGSGTFEIVYRMKNKHDKRLYAVKEVIMVRKANDALVDLSTVRGTGDQYTN